MKLIESFRQPASPAAVLSRIAALALLLLASAPPADAKNFIYKGRLKAASLVGDPTVAAGCYLIFGDEYPLTQDYTRLSATYVFVTTVEGRKRYSIAPGGYFRMMNLVQMVRGKSRMFCLIAQVDQSSETAGGDGGHSGSVMAFAGATSTDFPRLLTGPWLQTSGQGSLDSGPSGSAHLGKWTLTLQRDLTDPIPTGEPLSESVERVKAHLNRLGYLEIAP